MVLPEMHSWAVKKGISLLTTGDWTHPLWFREISEQLSESKNGVFSLKEKYKKVKGAVDPKLLLSVEISSIYTQGGKVRRVHNLIFVPSLKSADAINKELRARGANLSSDGRPIIGLSSRNLLELVMEKDKDALLVPCHAWTPWFSLYGSKSGFDSIEECFGDYSKYIYAVETGLSSDPFMNWKIKELNNRSILSFSDSHSAMRMAREATVFRSKKETEISYKDFLSAVKREKGEFDISYTIEFYPEEGKYHYTGHRNCNVIQTPDETRKNGDICPVCKRSLTVGVMHRVEELANVELSEESKMSPTGVKWIIDQNHNHPPFVKLVQLIQIVAEAEKSTVSSQKTINIYNLLCEKFESELNVLLRVKEEDLIKEAGERLTEGVMKVRRGEISINPGYDGEYGVVSIWSKDEKKDESKSIDKTQLGIDF